ncbi:MAG: hypothetical protein JXB14_01495 [Candidatus Altiarchaeota archaeon]|nr:hypothetical protein [Candidatus Altiarchaeota archaeon]
MPISNYPFLKEEKERLKDLKLKIDEIPEHPIYGHLLGASIDDINGKAKDLGDPDFSIISFTLSKILLSIADDKSLNEAYSERKSEEFRQRLERETLPFLIKIGREELGMDIKTEDSLRIGFIDFLRFKPDFLKLAQADLKAGYVQITKTQLSWLLKGAISKSILRSIPKKQKFPEAFQRAANRIKSQAKESGRIREMPRIKSLNQDALPPCIKEIIKSLQSKSANHNAHFVLATFLTTLKLGEKDILEIFKKSPKYNDKIARYQIQFIKERGYICPACDSVKSYGLCVANCPRNNPISVYFYNLKTRKPPHGKS